MSTCFRCGQRILRVKTQDGRPIALNPQPDPAGNVVLTVPGRNAAVLNTSDRDLAIARGEPTWRPHFATCTYHATEVQ